MNAQQIEQTASDWLTQRIGGSWSQGDQARLDAWIEEDLAHRIAYLRVESVWNQLGRLQAIGAGVVRGNVPPRDAAVRWVPPVATSPAPAVGSRKIKLSIVALAASIALVCITAGSFYFNGGFSHERYATKVGRMETVMLPDGSSVILNTDTRIRVDMKSMERRVELDRGEAFFEVAKDPARPFVVDIGGKRIVAVGTQFSVRRSQGDIRVTVTEGLVRVEGIDGKQDRAGLLRAGSIAYIRQEAVAIEQRPLPQAEELLSWRQGYLVFRDDTLVDAVAEFNRYNARKIVIADGSIASIRIGGNFRANGTDVFLWMLRNGFPILVEDNGREIVLKGSQLSNGALQPSSN